MFGLRGGLGFGLGLRQGRRARDTDGFTSVMSGNIASCPPLVGEGISRCRHTHQIR